MSATPHPIDPRRARLYRTIEVGRRALQWDDVLARQIFRQCGAGDNAAGTPSRTTMSIAQLEAVLGHMRACGFVPRRQYRRTDWRGPRRAKITALWCALADAGVIRDRSEGAMLRWVASQTGVARVEWAPPDKLNDCVEALKFWARREHVELQR